MVRPPPLAPSPVPDPQRRVAGRPSPVAPQEVWQQAVWHRLRRHWLLKAAGICAFMWLFFVAYFHVLRHPAWAVTVMPLTALDRAIPFTPAALGVYVSLWLYVGTAPGLMPTLREAAVYGLWAAAMCATGLVLFYLYPTAVPAPVPAIDVARHTGFALLQGVDAAGNACPSLHVAGALFTAIRVRRLLLDCRCPPLLSLLNMAWMLAIVWSTLATRQHVVLDAMAGAVLGAAFAWAALRWR